MPSPTYYDVLGITRTASDQDIKKSYRRLALKWHPDKNPQNKDDAETKFKEIAEAYEVLSDKNKKDVYDQYGEDGLKGNGPMSSTNGMYNWGYDPFNDQNNFHFRSPFDVFREFFGGKDPFEDFFHRANDPFADIFRMHSDPFEDIFASRLGRNCNNITSCDNNANNKNNSINGFVSTHYFDPFSTSMHDKMFSNGNGFFSTTSFTSSEPGQQPTANVRKTSTSTKFVNGKCIVTKKIVDKDSEIIEVTEDGKLMSKTVNGIMAPSATQTAAPNVHGETIKVH